MSAVRSTRTFVVEVAAAAALTVTLATGAFAPGAQASGVPPTPAVPDGFQWVEDDTHTIGLAVPAEWTVHPAPAVGPPGKLPHLFISATAPGPDGDRLSVELTADPIQGTPQPWDPSTCDPTAQECPNLIESAPFDDGSFVGYRQTIEGCCASGIYDVVEANAHDGSVAIRVYFNFGSERTPEEVATFDTMLGTIARVGAPMPAVEPLADPIFPYTDVHAVPQLGDEPVRGTGCGANGQIGETVPDGMWSGFVTVDGDTVGIDLVCVYPAETAEQFVDASDRIIWSNADSTIVNNNERVRTMPAASDLQLRDAIVDRSGVCVESAHLPDLDHRPFVAWVNIEAGEVTWIVWSCAAVDASSPAPSATAPPPAGDAPAEEESAALAADCEYAQHIVWEGDMYVGIEFPAEGGPIAGDFLTAVEASRDFFEYDRTQMRSDLARDAFANHYAVWSDFLEGGTFTQAGFEATVVAGFDAVAPFQLACGLPTATR